MSGIAKGGVNIYSAVDKSIIAGGTNTAIIGPERQPSNGLYYCLAGGSPQRYFVTLFLNTIWKQSKCMTHINQIY